MNKLRSIGLVVFLAFLAIPLSSAQEWTVGMSSMGTLIKAEGYQVDAEERPTVVLIGGLDGDAATTLKIQQAYQRYLARNKSEQPFNLIVIPRANPEGELLTFPPQGRAYADDPVSYSLWRWLGVHGPDLVLIESEVDYELADSLSNLVVAGVGYVPALHLYDEPEELEMIMQESDNLPISASHEMLDNRLARSPEQLVTQLGEYYGHDFSWPVYIPGMALLSRVRQGYIEEVEALTRQYLQGESINVTSNLYIGGHLIFAELAERTGNSDYLELARSAADLGWDENGNMREAMPFHREFSDDYFMLIPLLTKVGKLTGDRCYFDMALQHIRFLETRVRREDGLYRHSPLVDAAWSRANSFPALGLAMALSDFPESHPGYSELLGIYQSHMQALVAHQDIDGMWHMMINEPGIFAELSATAMIAAAMRRGIGRGWLDDSYMPVLEKAWRGVLMRTSPQGYFVNVCESTNKLDSMDAYMTREALMGPDDRAGGMIMYLATEMALLP